LSAAYREFVRAKSQLAGCAGFEPTFRHPKAYNFQSELVDWAVRQGRGAIFADCGLGKTLMQMTWAHNIAVETNKPVLIIAPLMVSMQTAEEAAKFDFEAERSMNGKFKLGAGIITTNYERLHHFDPDDFGGVVCDESSAIKNFEGSRKAEITEFMRLVRYRLLCSATPSPNDYVELGTSSEALGQLGYMDMLAMFFKNDEDSLHPMSMGSQWRFKTHAQKDFWRWVCSWARAVRKPSDLGYDDGPFVLPSLIENEHMVESGIRPGELFAMPAANLQEERDERRATIEGRCGRAADLLAGSEPGIAWCHLNAEAEALVDMIPGAAQISGADSDERKEELFNAFRHGELLKLVTKPKIAALGLNFQHCNRMTYFADHSFEQYYQAVRRAWRFGQKRDVTVDVVTTESLMGVTKNLRRKAIAAEEMFRVMVEQMNDALALKRFHEHTNNQEIPSWL
jgi:superfamily II DNA or RNA helicase